MNVSCNKCGKRYVISDDKLVGKTSVKIRCKQCQNLISVLATSPGVSPVPSVTAARPELVSAISAAAAPSPWDEERTRAMPAPDMSAAWYAMVQGKQIGPIGLRDLSEKAKAGEVSLRTYLWKPGMGDWKRASDVPEVSSVFAGISVGATATDAQKSSSGVRKSASSVQRDVALANEMPTPEARGHKSSPSGVNGNGRSQPPAAPPATGQSSAIRRPQSVIRPAAELAPQAEAPKKEEPRRKTSSGIKAASPAPAPEPKPAPAPLDDLFKDVPAPSVPNLAPVQDEATGEPAAAAAHHDPFAALGDPADKELPPPGEATKFFIAQAGVHKRNPPWKIALFVMIVLGVPVGALYLLSSLHIVPLTVTRTTEDGKEVQEEFFSGGGMSGLKDMLTGEAKRKAAEAERLRKEKEAKELAARHAAKPADDAPPKPKPVDPNLAAFYQEDDGKKTKVPKNREAQSGSTQVATGGLADDVAAKVVLDRQKAFNDCIDQALRRNPGLAVGSINIVLHVGASGAVKQVEVDPQKHAGSDWAQCMMNVGKRIVFPPSDGETEVRAPFKIGVSVGP